MIFIRVMLFDHLGVLIRNKGQSIDRVSFLYPHISVSVHHATVDEVVSLAFANRASPWWNARVLHDCAGCTDGKNTGNSACCVFLETGRTIVCTLPRFTDDQWRSYVSWHLGRFTTTVTPPPPKQIKEVYWNILNLAQQFKICWEQKANFFIQSIQSVANFAAPLLSPRYIRVEHTSLSIQNWTHSNYPYFTRTLRDIQIIFLTCP